MAAGIYAVKNIPLDAIPDLSDTQVIIYSRWDRSPDILEDQVTYPIVTAMLGVPKVKAVRGFSDFGFSDFGNLMTKKQLVILLFLQKIRYLHLKKYLGF